ncbi:periplasmic binding protein-like II [Neocallimastix californiae]|uniref:Periplasmic binding protein-like II n=1 Tax=Neocallimastix californiae TaxID=1754190 RepID=A0A1Y2FPH3_9FUNG|nr:periplasmic binding protein-like II [Neocallimastix californiae]|eukprot:ORY85900.1 periplasmic binding protein-like II [Neocallimastix californiae]
MVTLPFYIKYNMLYSNQNLLDKYNKPIPKTWNELINTAKFILTEESKSGNEIIGYAADMTDSEIGFSSFYEYIYSFRKDVKNSFPIITDSEAVEAMIKLKELKEELGEHGIRSTDDNLIHCLNSSDCLFVKTWNTVPHIGNYTLSNLPGNTEGISGSCIGGYNMGINKYISNEKKKKAAKIIEYFASYDFQKNTILNYGFQTALEEIYDDKLICQRYEQCQDFKYIQSILRPIYATEDYSEYSRKFRNYLLKYLYENASLNECLQNIEYLTKIFYEENSTLMNKFYIILLGITILYMILTFSIAFTQKYKSKFKLLNPFYWFLYMLGQIIIMCYGIAGMGETTDFKCQIRPIIFSVGFTLGNTILLVRMLINFPESERHFVRFCEKNFGKTILFSFAIDAILNVIALIEPYGVERIIDGNIMYNKCKLSSTIGLVAVGFIFLYKLLILLAMAILIFIEWNIQEFKHDIRYATATLFISFIIYLLFGMVQNMKIGGYKERFFIPAMITYIYGLSCYSVYFVTRFFSNYNMEDTEESIIKKAIHGSGSKDKPTPQGSFLEKYTSNVSLNQSNNSFSSKKASLTDHLMSLHNYGNEIRKSYDHIKGSNNSLATNLSATRVNLRKSSRSFSNIDETGNMNRRASQITAIPENKIADSYGGSSSSNTNSNPSDSIGQDTFLSEEHMSRSRTHSSDNFSPSFTRMNRINSTPNKKFMGYGNMKSCEKFPSVTYLRKGSNISFTNVHPMNATSYSNLPTRKESMPVSITSDSSCNSTDNKLNHIKSDNFIVNIQNPILENNDETSERSIDHDENNRKNEVNSNDNNNNKNEMA